MFSKEELELYINELKSLKSTFSETNNYLENLFQDEIKASWQIEESKITKDKIDTLITYLNDLYNIHTHNTHISIKQLYTSLFPENEFIRIDEVVVGGCYFDSYGQIKAAKHVGISPKYVKEVINYLENEANDFYKYIHSSNDSHLTKLIKAFEKYIKFESLHPFIDGNGRMGRLLFLEIPFHFKYPFAKYFQFVSPHTVNNILFKYQSLPYNGYNNYTLSDYENVKFDEIDIYKIIYSTIAFANFYKFDKIHIFSIKSILKGNFNNKYYDYEHIIKFIGSKSLFSGFTK